MMKIDRTKIYGGMFLVFLLGILSGSLGTQIYLGQSILDQKYGHSTRGDRFSKKKAQVMEKLNSELGLTPSQKSEIEKILNTSFDQLRKLREKHRPEVEKTIDQGVAAMKDKLNEEQKRKLDKLYEDFLLRRKQWDGTSSAKGTG